MGCTLKPPGPVPLGVKNDTTVPDSVVVAFPDEKDASEDRGTDDPTVPNVAPVIVGAAVSVEDEADSVSEDEVALALEVALSIDVADETSLELKFALTDDVRDESVGSAELVAFALSVLKGSAEDWAPTRETSKT